MPRQNSPFDAASLSSIPISLNVSFFNIPKRPAVDTVILNTIGVVQLVIQSVQHNKITNLSTANSDGSSARSPLPRWRKRIIKPARPKWLAGRIRRMEHGLRDSDLENSAN